MSTFRFKKFDVVNERSAMKVNTDGVLLGAAMTIHPTDRRMLDIGTGTGTIALMAAQRLAARTDAPRFEVHAIDIDGPSATEAAANFANSLWADSLHAYHTSLDDFALNQANLQSLSCESITDLPVEYDLIFSNPPYFEDSLTAPDQRKSTARHTSDGLSYRDILEFAIKHLSPDGRVAFVLPADQEDSLCRYARMCGLHLFRILRVRTVPRKAPSRIIAEFSRHRVSQLEDSILTIQNEGQYTQEYLSLTKDFYLFA
jgi:tRNA1Val (adenine37-N6)-methyltransferase